MWCYNDGVKYDLKMIMILEILKIIKVYKDFFFMNYCIWCYCYISIWVIYDEYVSMMNFS